MPQSKTPSPLAPNETLFADFPENEQPQQTQAPAPPPGRWGQYQNWLRTTSNPIGAGLGEAEQRSQDVVRGVQGFFGQFSPLGLGGDWGVQARKPPIIPNTLELLAYPEKAVPTLFSPLTRSVQGIGALIAPDQVQAPSPQQWSQATQTATQEAMPTLIRGAAPILTDMGIPRTLAQWGASTGSPVADVATGIPRAMLRGAARYTFEPTDLMRGPSRPMAPPKTAEPIQAEFVDQPTAPPSTDIDVGSITPEGMRRLTTGRSGQRQVTGVTPQKALGEVPPGTTLHTGQEGGIADQPHSDITGQKALNVRAYKGDGTKYTPGQFRPETPNEMNARLTNLGRQAVRSSWQAEAEPLKPWRSWEAAKPPKAPPKGK